MLPSPLLSMYNSLKRPLDLAAFSIPEEEAFIRFMHETSQEEAEQVMAVAVEVLSLWQQTGSRLTRQPPGYILVNMAEAALDPLAQIGIFNHGMGHIGPDGAKGGDDTPLDVKRLSLESMRAFTKKYRAKLQYCPSESAHQLEWSQEVWKRYQGSAFGIGRSAGYTDRWDEELGLVTDEDGSIVLLIHRDEDWALFREHVMKEPRRLTDPWGWSTALERVTKVACISGTLYPRQLDDAMLESILVEGLPILMLPHPVISELAAVRSFPLFTFTDRFVQVIRSVRTLPKRVPVKPPIDGVPMLEYEGILLSLSRHLPANYGFYLMRTIRELHLVCEPIAVAVAGSGKELTRAISRDLRHMTIRGLVTGVASLAYHGWCFDSGIPRNKLVKLLEALRETGEMTFRELQRVMRDYNAQTLRSVLEILEGQGLVQVDGKTVTVVPMSVFVRTIPARYSFPILKLETEAFMETLRDRGPGPQTVSQLEILASLRGKPME